MDTAKSEDSPIMANKTIYIKHKGPTNPKWLSDR